MKVLSPQSSVYGAPDHPAPWMKTTQPSPGMGWTSPVESAGGSGVAVGDGDAGRCAGAHEGVQHDAPWGNARQQAGFDQVSGKDGEMRFANLG